MPPSKKRGNPNKKDAKNKINTHIEGAGIVEKQLIDNTLKENYMPYAMSVILSRAIPEIDGFKPSHRKILYTMYKMGLLNGGRTKSANIVGQTMRLNPHGDAAIYETMVRLSRGNGALLHSYVDSKGNFGKSYSRDMAYAAARYTEAKLDSICSELFSDIDKDTVDFVDNYDSTTTEPVLLPTTFPTILVNSNVGIAVGMASSICSFNLEEVCQTTIALMKNANHEVSQTLKAPDFTYGGIILYDENEINKIYTTGRGSLKVRARYTVDRINSVVEITEIPPSTTVEAIIDKIVDLSKTNKIREISDIRDETDINGLKITIDLKRGVDGDKLMQKLYKLTTLQDSFSCNFNVLVGGVPRVLGVKELLEEWIAFRIACVKRRVYFTLNKQKEKLHLLKALGKILLDIDKAIKIVRETQEENEVVPNLMIGFGIDRVSGEYVAEIKLRNLNKEYILKRTSEIEELTTSIAELEEVLQSKNKVNKIIIKELETVVKKYAQPRKSLIVYDFVEMADVLDEAENDYNVTVFVTEQGYFKKITPQSLRMSGEQKLKEDDRIKMQAETTNNAEMLLFSDKSQVYKAKISDFDDTKASVMGDYIPAKLGFDEGESLKVVVITTDYSGFLMFFFENGKIARVPLSSYQTKTKRKKLINAYSNKSRLVDLFCVKEETDFLIKSTNDRGAIINSVLIPQKATKDTQGVFGMTQKKNHHVDSVCLYCEGSLDKQHRFVARNIPTIGAAFKTEDIALQLTLE